MRPSQTILLQALTVSACWLALVGPALGEESLRIKWKPEACRVVIQGRETIECNSQWHANLKITQAIHSEISLSPEVLAALVPDKALVSDEEWELPAAFRDALAKALFEQRKVTLNEAAASSGWEGSGPEKPSFTPAGALVGRLKEVNDTPEGEVVRILLRGEIGYERSVRYSSRFGPNQREEGGRVPLSGELKINLQTGALDQLRFSLEGSVKGVYTNKTPQLEEPYTISGVYQGVTLTPLTQRQTADVKALIQQLGDDEFAVRERASQQLGKWRLEARHLLEAAAQNSPDAEIRTRLRNLLDRPAP